MSPILGITLKQGFPALVKKQVKHEENFINTKNSTIVGSMSLVEQIQGALASEDKNKLIIGGVAVLVVLVILVILILGSISGTGTLTVNVKNPESTGIWKASIRVVEADETFLEKTDRSGIAEFAELPTGKELTLNVSATGFKSKEQKVTLSGSENDVSITLEPEIENQANFKSITFVGPNGVKLQGKVITVELTCSTGMVLDNPIKQISSGELEISVPSGCGTLLANVSGSGYETATHNVDESNIVRLEAITYENGSVRFSIKDETERILDGIEVTINDSRGIPTGETAYSAFGKVSFSLLSGDYVAEINDSSFRYASVQENFSVTASEESVVEISLSEKPIGIVKAKAIDKNSKAGIEHATIILEGPDGEKVSREFLENDVSFALGKAGVYTLMAVANGYKLSNKISIDSGSLNSGEKSFTVELNPCTPGTCGALTIKVVDEDSLPVANARIALTDPDTGFFVEEYGLKQTDFEGKVVFRAVASGSYQALAQKYPAEGTSATFEVIEGTEAEATVELFVGEGTIEVAVVDSDLSPIPFGFAEFRSDSGTSLGKLPLDAEGKGSLLTKADKRVFVVVDVDGYTTYTSKAFQVYAGKTNTIVTIMRKDVLGENPVIEFLGIYNEQGKEIKGLKAGSFATAKFKVTVPTEIELEQLGVFLRIGEDASVEKDSVYINKVNAPKASVLKGETFNPPRGTSEDEENLTNNDAKWASIVWDSDEIRAGIYEVEAEFFVKASTTPGKFMPLYYRAFGVESNGDYLRDPFDTDLGYSESTGTKQALYANSHEKVFYEGAVAVCDEDFCYTERVLDKGEDLYIDEPYNARIFGNYNLDMSLTNNSAVVHDNGEIRIKNSGSGAFTDEKLKIQKYNLVNADAQEFSSTKDTFEINPIFLGDFRQNKTVTGNFDLRPEVLGPTALQMQVVSDQQIVYERFVLFNVVNKEDLNIVVLPKTLPAFTDFDLNVSVRLFKTDDPLEFEEIDDAFVKVTRITPDRQKSIFTTRTDGKGIAVLNIPSSEPGTKIQVRVEKEGYAGKTINLRVTDEIILFDPAKLDSKLDLTNNTEEKLDLKATNLVPINLHLTKMKFSGNFLGLLDERKMNNYLEQYVGRTDIVYNFPFLFNVLSSISDDARLLDEVKKLKGQVIFEVANPTETIKWPLAVHYDTTINLAEPPKEEGCIDISLKEWKDATLGGSAQVEFSILNNCLTQRSEPLDVRNLKAKVDWKSNKFGNVELHVLDHETGQEATETLSDSIYSTFFDYVPAGKEYTGLLVFTPKGGNIGETAEFDVIIDAAQLTNAGEQLVGASNVIVSEINIIDLSTCITYTPDAEAGLVLQESEEEGTIEINSSACGNITIDFWLCKDDPECSGGVDGGITAKPEKFTLTSTTPNKTILVSRQDIPGMYGLTVDVRTPGSNYREIQIVDVLVKPEKEDAFELTKYEFAVKGIDAKDSAELRNRYLSEVVTVDASICDWGEATENKDSWWDWTGAGVGAVVGAVLGIKPAIEAGKDLAETAASTAAESVKGAEQAIDTATAADQKTGAEFEALCNLLSTNQTEATTAHGACSLSPDIQTQLATASTAIGAALTECQTITGETQAIDTTNTATTEALDEAQGTLYDGIPSGEPTGSWYNPTPSTQAITKNYEKPEVILFKDNSEKEIAQFAGTGIFAKVLSWIGIKKTEQLTAVQASSRVIETKLATATGLYTEVMGQQATTCTAESVATLGSTIPACTACFDAVGVAQTATAESTTELEAVTDTELAESGVQVAAEETAVVAAEESVTTATTQAGSVVTATNAASSFSTGWFGTVLGAYTAGGFIVGGLYNNLFGDKTDPCTQRYSNGLPDYLINLIDDAGAIESELGAINVAYDTDSAQVIGSFEEQRMGIVVTNNGIDDPRPVYSTVTFNATQHLHANPTKISRGDDDFGPFNVPDEQKLNLKAKIHLKFKTQEVEESIPDLSFDTLSCESGNRIGRTGTGALPKVKLDWSFQSIGDNECSESNPEGIYCDGTQFNIMLSKRLNNLKEFFDVNPTLECPVNPLAGDFESLTSGLDINGTISTSAESCFITDWSGFIEGRPAIEYLVEANENAINWTPEIPDKETFLEHILFNATLMKDSYTPDFRKDFAKHYSEDRFFDTPDWFYGIGLNSSGKEYGIGTLYSKDRIQFTNRFYDSDSLPSAGIYQILIDVKSEDGTYRFFDADGNPNVTINTQLNLLEEPNPNSAFYSLPFDGMVGLEGDSLNRQGYGVSFENANSTDFVLFDNEATAMKSFTDSGSNAEVKAKASVKRDLQSLNSSAASRGNLLTIERTSASGADIRFQPSKATPVLMKVTENSINEDTSSAFYIISANDVPADVGAISSYWDGAGACLDFSGVVITESFDNRADRAAISTDPVLNWERAYGLDFGAVNYTGDVYLRTIYYTNPKEPYEIRAEYPNGRMSFMTPDSEGSKIVLNGVAGAKQNNPSGGSLGSVQSVKDIFTLVENETVCVTDTGRKASFFWNPKSVYELDGKQRNISEFTNNLVAGQTCIGFG